MRVTGDDVAALAAEVAGSTRGDHLDVHVWRGGLHLCEGWHEPGAGLDVSAWALGWDADRQVQGQATLTLADPDGVLAPWGMGDALAPGGSRLSVAWVSGSSGVRVPLGWWRIRAADPVESWRVYRRLVYSPAVTHDVVRTNLATDPAATQITSWDDVAGGAAWTTINWFGTGGAGTHTIVTGASDGPLLDLTTYMRKTWTTGTSVTTTTGIRHSRSDVQGLPVQAGQALTVSSWLRASTAKIASMRLEWRDASGNTVGTAASGSATDLPANTWTRIVCTATVPAGAVYVGIVSHITGGAAFAAGDILDGTGLFVEESGTVGDYFDGDTPDTPGVVHAWTGPEHASASTQTTRIIDVPATESYGGTSWSVPPLVPSDTTPPSETLPPSDGASGFVAPEIVRVPGGGTVTVRADEEMATVQLDRLDAEAIPDGATCLGEITRLLADICGVDVHEDVTDRAVPADLVYGLSRADAVGDLLDILDAACRMGPDGSLQVVPATGGDPVWTITGGDDGALISLAHALSDEGVHNAAVSTGEAPDGTPLVGRARTMGGPLEWGGPFGRVPIFHNAAATTQTGVDADAATVLARHREVDLMVDCLTHPGVQPQDVVTVIAATRAGDQPLTGRVVGVQMRSVTTDGGTVPAKRMALRVRVDADALEAVAARIRRA